MSNAQPGLGNEVIQEVRREAVRQTAKWAIGFVAILIVAALAGWWLYLQYKLPAWLGSVPSNAVVAFDISDQCPDGWQDFADLSGRVIVGTGVAVGQPSERRFRVEGGSETFTLGADQLPPHDHPIEALTTGEALAPAHLGFTSNAGAWFIDQIWIRPRQSNETKTALETHNAPTRRTLAQDGTVGAPVSVMPPYLPLRFCKKT